MPTGFYDGRPCRRCGETKRYLSYRACVACQLKKNRKASLDGVQAVRSKRYYAKNPVAARKRVSKWKKRNKAKIRSQIALRRASKLQRTPKWLTRAQKAKMAAMYAEAARRTKETGVAWHVDHIAPLNGQTVCGLHVPENLQLLPAVENMRKGNRFLAEAADQSPD